MPILVGTDGHRKMSKSLGNQIGVTDEPGEMYGKTLSIPDEAIAEYYRLLFPRGISSDPATSDPDSGQLQPRDAKRALARGIVAWLHSPAAAEQAEREFDRVHIEHAAPEQIEEARFVAGEDGQVHLPGLIVEAFGGSRSEARRLIDQGAVSLGGEPLGKGEHDVSAERADGQVLKVGKRRFRRLVAG
jgi:tyrosyl-tRNA synthetase